MKDIIKNININPYQIFVLIQTLVLIACLFYIFGWIAVFLVFLTLSIILNIFLGFVAFKSLKSLRATEVGLQFVFNKIDEKYNEIDTAIKEMVWIEDVPEVRKIAKLLLEAREEILKAPIYFNGTVAEELFMPEQKEKNNENIENTTKTIEDLNLELERYKLESKNDRN